MEHQEANAHIEVLKRIDKLTTVVTDLAKQLAVDSMRYAELHRDVERVESGVKRGGEQREVISTKLAEIELKLVRLEGLENANQRLAALEGSTKRTDGIYDTVVRWAIPAFIIAALSGGAVKYFGG